MRNSKRKFITATLLLISVLLTSSTFAYWATYVEGTSEEVTSTLSVGTAKNVQTTISINDETVENYGLLVPEGQLSNSTVDSVTEMFFAFDMTWNEDNETSMITGETFTGYLEATISYEIITTNNISLDLLEYENIYDLINITPVTSNSYEFELNATVPNTISYKVTMSEPNSQEEYNLISSSTIQITFNFSISTQETNPYGNNIVEIASYIENLTKIYYDDSGSYPRSWGDYAYTDIGLNPEDFEESYYNFEVTPRGKTINFGLNYGYTLTVLDIYGEEISFSGSYNWNLVYSIENSSWYHHSVTEGNEIDITTLTVVEN